MTIHIVPQDELAEGHKTAGNIPPVLFANLNTLYMRRATRMRKLAEDSLMDEYLMFAGVICDAQQQVLDNHPLTVDLRSELLKADGKPPLDCRTFPRTSHWQTLLDALLKRLKPGADEGILGVMERLERAPSLQREMMATQFLNQDFQHAPAENAPFIWAALSLYWAQMAAQLRGVGRADFGENRQFCPVCGSVPVAGVISLGVISGLRYLHCNLCESEWHVVRAKCSNCDEVENLNYWALTDETLDEEQPVVKAESCDDCGAYLKVIYHEKDPQADAVADDLATMLLDDRMESKGFSSSGLNPFMFPAK